MIARPALRVWFLLGLLLVSVLGMAQEYDRFAGADDILTRAEAFAAKHDYESAADLLRHAIARYPTYPPLYTNLIDWQEAAGLAKGPASGTWDSSARRQLLRTPETARRLFETFGQATIYLADAQDIRQHIEMLTQDDFPVMLGQYGPLALPGNPQPFTYSLTDPRLPVEQRGMQQGLITTVSLPAASNYRTDPKYGADSRYSNDPKYGGWVFRHMLYAYDYDRSDQSWHLRFRVMWQDAPGAGASRLRMAQESARLLLRLHGTVRAYTGLTPRFVDGDANGGTLGGGAVNVWLTEKGDPGAEAFNENIYIYNLGTPRSGTEWAREFAHEFGHLALKPIGGYTQPEWGANGRLGERLFLRWLCANTDPAEAHPWVRDLNPRDIAERRLFPSMRQFAEVGAAAPLLRGTDEAAMDGFVGMALYLEQVRGSRFLASVLNEVTSPSFSGPNGFLAAVESMEQYLQTAIPSVTLRLRDLPQGIPYRVYLCEGTWQGEMQGKDIAVGMTELNVDGKTVPFDVHGKFTLSGITTGWHTLRFIPVGDVPLPEPAAIRLTK